MTPIRRRPCADPGQKQVPGEWMTQKGIDSSRPVTEASCAQNSGKCTRVFTASSPKITRHSRTQWFYGLYALSPEIGLSCLRRPRSCLRELDASVEAPGPHDLAVRFSAARQEHIRVHRISSRVRDDRDTPLLVGRDESGYADDLGRRGTGIFFAMGLDSPDHTKSGPSGARFFGTTSSAARMDRART